MAKRILSIALSLILMLNVFAVAVSAVESEADYNAKLYLTADTTNPQPGDTVTVTFALKNDYYLGAINAMVAYDTNYYDVVGTDTSDTFNVLDDSSGISFSAAVQSRLSGKQAAAMYPSFYTDDMKEQYSLIKLSFIWRLQTALDNGTSMDSAEFTDKTDLVSFKLKVKDTAPTDGYGLIWLDPQFELTDTSDLEARGATYVSRREGNLETAVAASYGQTLDFKDAALFKAPEACTHSTLLDWEVTVPATCQTTGTKVQKCASCGVIVNTETIPLAGHTPGAAATCTEAQVCTVCGTEITPALGHDYVAGTVVAPTCTTGGYTTFTCSRCDDTYNGSETDVLGHDYVAVVTAPTCTEDGYTTYTCSRCNDSYTDDETDALGHDYVAGTVVAPTCTEGGYTPYTCSRCGDTYNGDETDALGHTAGAAATCTEAQVCTVCGTELAAALGHNYVPTAGTATCTEAGTTTYTCSRCGDNYSESSGSPLGHDYVAVVTAPTCTEDGYTTYTCSRCGDTYVADSVDALGHDYETVVTAPTCTEDGYTTYTCSRCADTYTADAVDALGHNYVGVVTAPTCTEGGYTTYTCSRCDDTYTGDTVAALGHDYESVVTAPTCTEDGYTTYTCSRCDASYTDNTVAALGHDYVAVITDPTCTEEGYTTYTCSRCDDTYTADERDAIGHVPGAAATCTEKQVCTICGEELAPALGHNPGEWVVTVNPTCTEAGTQTKTCTRCSELLDTASIDALGHDWSDWTTIIAPTTTSTGLERRDCSRCDEFEENILQKLVSSPADYSAVNAAKNSIPADLSGYTDKSVEALNKVLEEIDYDLGIDDQETVNNYATSINNAISALKVIPTRLANYDELDLAIARFVPYGSNRTNGIYDADELAALDALIDSFDRQLGRADQDLIDNATTGYAAQVIAACDALTVDETKATAAFSITTDKTLVKENDVVTVSVKVAANYPIDVMSIPVIYDANVFAPLNTSASQLAKFLTFKGQLSTGSYRLNGNYKATDGFDKTSNDAFWGTSDAKDQYAYALASWVYDSSINPANLEVKTPHEVVVTFQLEVISSDDDISSKIFISPEWQKTSTNASGTLFAGRAIGQSAYDSVRVGQTFSFNDATLTVNPPCVHQYGTVVTAPTCTEDGYTTYTCSLCGDTYTADAVDALGHNYVGVVTAPTCTEDGYTTYTCSRCNSSYTDDEVDALGHNYVAVVTTPTCTEDGYKTYTCSRCDASYTDNIVAALGHNYVAVVTAPTCTEDGYTTYTCSRCNASYTADAVDALGHTAGAAATCTEDQVCTVCGAVLEEAHGHTEGTPVVVAPTATREGSKTISCTECGTVLSETAIPALSGKFVASVESNGTVVSAIVDENYVGTISIPRGASVNAGAATIGVSMTDVAGLGISGKVQHEKTFNTGIEKLVNLDNYIPEFDSATVSGMVDGVEYSYSLAGINTAEKFDIVATPNDADAAAAAFAALTSHITTSTAAADDSYIKLPGKAYIKVADEVLSFEDENGTLLIDNVSNFDALSTAVRNALKLGSAEEDNNLVTIFLPAGTVLSVGSNIATLNDDATITLNGISANAGVTGILSLLRDCTSLKDVLKTVVLFTNDLITSVDGNDVTLNIEFNHIPDGDWVIITEPTCTTAGTRVKYCKMCGEIAVTEDIDPLQHDYVAVVTAPTCTEDGYTTYTCSVCGDTYTADETEALGHDYESVVTAPTCTEGGYTTFTCSVCGDTYTGDETEALGHDEGDWEVISEASCTVDGVKVKHCTRCGEETSREVVDALGHDPIETVIAPTCTTRGYTEVTCSRCNYLRKTNPTNALGHDYVAVVTAPTCTEAGYTTFTCSRGDSTYVGDETEALGHSAGDWTVITEPTCTEAGVQIKTCAVCGVELERETISALGHDYVIDTVVDPTCTEGGYTTYSCSRCDATKTGNETDALGHDWGEWTDDATRHGFQNRVCARCGEVESREVTVHVTGIVLSDNFVKTRHIPWKPAFTITATVLPDNAENKTVIWSSDNEKVATVDQNGNVTTHHRGTATITATTEDGEFVETCKVEVVYQWWQWLIWIFLLGCIWYFI